MAQELQLLVLVLLVVAVFTEWLWLVVGLADLLRQLVVALVVEQQPQVAQPQQFLTQALLRLLQILLVMLLVVLVVTQAHQVAQEFQVAVAQQILVVLALKQAVLVVED